MVMSKIQSRVPLCISDHSKFFPHENHPIHSTDGRKNNVTDVVRDPLPTLMASQRDTILSDLETRQRHHRGEKSATKYGVTETRLRESGQNGEEYRLDLLERHKVVNTLFPAPALAASSTVGALWMFRRATSMS